MSGEMKHTPAPWKVGVDNDHYLWSLHVFADDQDGDINIAWCSCSQDDAQNGEDAPRLTEARANARLIAAAPDILKALKLVIAVADRKTVEFDLAHAAVAKAEGRAALTATQEADDDN